MSTYPRDKVVQETEGTATLTSCADSFAVLTMTVVTPLTEFVLRGTESVAANLSEIDLGCVDLIGLLRVGASETPNR
jgi:hypothetical protein